MCYDISYTVNVKELADYFPDLEFHSQLELDFDAGIHIMGHSYADHPDHLPDRRRETALPRDGMGLYTLLCKGRKNVCPSACDHAQCAQ